MSENIGEHFQVYLEGWKVKPKKLEVEYEEEDGKMKKYLLGTQEENLALMEQFKEDPKRLEILDYHWQEYLEHVFRINKIYENS